MVFVFGDIWFFLEEIITHHVHAEDGVFLLLFEFGMELLYRGIGQVGRLVEFVVFAEVFGIVVFKREPGIACVGQHQVWLGACDDHEVPQIIFLLVDQRWILHVLLDNQPIQLLGQIVQVVNSLWLFFLFGLRRSILFFSLGLSICIRFLLF